MPKSARVAASGSHALPDRRAAEQAVAKLLAGDDDRVSARDPADAVYTVAASLFQEAGLDREAAEAMMSAGTASVQEVLGTWHASMLWLPQGRSS